MITMLTAHSGSDQTPENSLEFVRYALSTSADALEVDVRISDGGELLLGHDQVFSHSTSLREAFSLIASHPSMKVNCDLKDYDLEHDTYQLACEYHLEDRLIFSGSVRVNNLHAEPSIKDHVSVFLNIEEYIPDLYQKLKDDPSFSLTAARLICDICSENDISVINTYYKIATDEFLKYTSEHNICVSCWTVNEISDLSDYFSKNVYNITTRNLKSALALRNSLSDK